MATAPITTANCMGVIERVMSDPRCRPDATALIDLSGATGLPVDRGDIIQIANAVEAFHSRMGNRIAIVAKRAMLFPAEIFSLHVREAVHVGIRVFVDPSAAEDFCRGADNHPPPRFGRVPAR